MALKKSKSKKVKEENLEVEVEEVSVPNAEADESVKEDLVVEEEKESTNLPSGEDLEYTLGLIGSKFNLGENFTVSKFDNGLNKVKITVDSREFEISILVKDKSSYGFPSILKMMGEV